MPACRRWRTTSSPSRARNGAEGARRVLTPKRLMRTRTFNQEVLYTDEPVTKVTRHDVDVLKALARQTARQRSRLCAHPDAADTLHEMLIVHPNGTYVRPHKHPRKSESFHVIEGAADVVIFDEAGHVTEVMPMGDYASGRQFYYRMDVPYYHTLLISSDVLVFHETTNGPFRSSDTVFPSWAPEENDLPGRAHFLNDLKRAVAGLAARS
jgi:cupin fold WbuC family metalloprotein